MSERIIKNNRVTICGEIVSNFVFSHELYGEKFFESKITTSRKSDVEDIVPITVSERLLDVSENWINRRIRINGQFRSRNAREKDKKRLLLSVFARTVEELPFLDDENYVFLDGFICKEPKYRETPLGREITDIIVAANRPYGKSDYIPCICWGRNAKFAGNLAVGTHIHIEGRIQSREYKKKISEEECEDRIAYEVSVSKIEVSKEKES